MVDLNPAVEAGLKVSFSTCSLPHPMIVPLDVVLAELLKERREYHSTLQNYIPPHPQ